MTKIAGSGSGSESGSISQRHGSADPDPHQNVMDPQHCATLFDVLYFWFHTGVATSTLDIHYFCLGFVLWTFLEVDWKLVCSGAELL
jgi:hypothetical protein